MFATKLFSRVASLATILILALSNVQAAHAAPANDNFADATQITSLTFSVNADNTGATSEAGEPNPSCGYGYNLNTVWYAFTPSTNASLTASSSYYNFAPLLAIYSGSWGNLTQLACGNFYTTLTFQAQAGITYYFQLSGLYGDQGTIPFSLAVTPPPQVNIFYNPTDPNIFDSVSFYANINDPGNIGIATFAWTSSDGASSNQFSFYHQFASDGNYTVNLTATTYDGRTGSASNVVQVRTKDVAITKFGIPQTARANQTKTINVDVQNKRYSDNVRVTFIKGLPGGGEQAIGTLTLYVPAQAKQATTFKFSYTFTPDDAAVGKITFKAVADIINGRDALPSDNTSIATTIVSR
jgi:hypothetical protein